MREEFRVAVSWFPRRKDYRKASGSRLDIEENEILLNILFTAIFYYRTLPGKSCVQCELSGTENQ
jgi:hypothetical protein